MRSQNIKYTSPGKVGGASCLVLLLLTFLSINPATSLSAFAEESTTDEAGIPATQEDIPSTIGISFAPAAGSTSLSPTTATGQSAQINVLATVNVQNSGGYSVYLKSDTQNLVGQKDSDNVIQGATVAKTYNAMDVNTWGYYAGEGSSVPEGATYKAISVSGNGDRIAENGNSKIKTDTKNIMLSFAAKINDEMPADTYQNTVTMSVVSSPLQITLTDITNMQDMTSSICEASAMYETKQLRDTRDGKFYWVTKLADNNCWMTQNLDLDLSTSAALTPADSDVKEDWTPSFDTATEVNDSTILADNTGTRSWSLGNVRITNPTEADSCGSSKAGAIDCLNQFEAYTTPVTANKDEDAHYIIGNHYQWNAAIAGTSEEVEAVAGERASESICPRGWSLPSSMPSGGELTTLVNALGIGTNIDKITSAPFYAVRGGDVQQDKYLFQRAGDYGAYWSSTIRDDHRAYLLTFHNPRYLHTADFWGWSAGLSVRCIARQNGTFQNDHVIVLVRTVTEVE